MTTSGLIVFLPLVGAILGAVVGAFCGAWVNSWYRDREAKNAEDRERYGLLLLINAELHHDEFILIELIDDPDKAQLDTHWSFPTDTWTGSKVRLVQLLPKDHFTALANYYSWLDTYADVWHDDRMSFDERIDEAKGFVSFTLLSSNAAKQLGAKYISDDPDLNLPFTMVSEMRTSNK